MAEEGEDVQGSVQEERLKILELQSEQFRKQEQLARLKNKREALNDELATRDTEFQMLMNELSEETKKEEAKSQGKEKVQANATAAAEGDYIKKQVQKLLQARVPVMATVHEEGDDAHANFDGEAPKQEEAQKTVHNTVLINYVQLLDNVKKYRTLQVTYRIDTDTKPKQLLKDACAYWGCSQKEHHLYTKDAPPAEVTAVDKERGEEKLVEILNTNSESILYLVSLKDEQRWKDALTDENKKKQNQAAQQQAERTEPDDQTGDSGGWFQTLMSFNIFAREHRNEKPEDFINAFKQWPGIFYLLKDRSRSREDSVKWQNVPFSDWVIFLFLIMLSCLIIGYQNGTNLYELRAGVEGALIHGLPGENFKIAQPETYLFDTFESSGPGLLWAEATEGVSWADGSLHLVGANQSIRSRKALPLDARLFQVESVLAADANCTEYSIAFGSQNSMLQFSWDCNKLAISSPGNVSSSAARGCSSHNPYTITANVDMQGTISLNEGSGGPGCANVTLTLKHDLHEIVRPLYMFLRTTGGNGILNHILVTTRLADPVMNFRDIRRANDMWNWLGGPFIYQLFDKDSSLRRNYVPVGYMRIRQQKVKQKECARVDIPSNLAKPCHYVEVNEASRDESEIPEIFGWKRSQFQRDGGADPRIWQKERLDIESPFGLVQHHYDSSGYAADYHLVQGDIGAEEARQFSDDLGYFRTFWISTNTRMVSVEVTLADHHLGGYVNVRLLLEISASGAIVPSALVIPFHIFKNRGDEIADGLNVLRWIIMIILIMLFRVYREGKRKSELGKSGLNYIFSYNGILDMSIIGLFFAMQFMRLQQQPLSPYTLTQFYSYNRAADRKAQLRIAEAAFLCLILAKWSTLMRLFPVIFRLFKTFSNSMTLFFYFCAMFVPVFGGNIFCANAIWQPFSQQMSTWSNCLYVFFLSLQESFDTQDLYTQVPDWALAFLFWFFVSIRIFFLHMFLAITVHSYFQVELIEGIKEEDALWDKAQWLDWMLWPYFFEKLGMGQSGISRNKSSQQGAAGDDDEDSEDDDDAEGKDK